MPEGIALAKFDSFTQVTVQYEAVFRQVITEHSGGQIRFLYLGRFKVDGRWQILPIGTGP